MPSRGARRASFLPRPERRRACTLGSFFSPMISPYRIANCPCQLPIAGPLQTFSNPTHCRLPFADFRFEELALQVLQIENRQMAIGNSPGLLMVFFQPSVFALR